MEWKIRKTKPLYVRAAYRSLFGMRTSYFSGLFVNFVFLLFAHSVLYVFRCCLFRFGFVFILFLLLNFAALRSTVFCCGGDGGGGSTIV